MYRHLLVPLDGSELGTDLVTQALEFARGQGASITFFTMREDFGSSQEGALVRTLSSEAYADASAGDANAILAKAMAAAGEYGVECAAIVRTGNRPHELILQVAAERGCDLIYMASHGRRGLKALVLGSQTRKVLDHATLPVLVASVASNIASSACESAISVLRDEHRTIATVCNGLRRVAAQARSGEAVDFAFLEALLRYLLLFPEVLHHPKEEGYLFAALAARTDEAAELLARLAHEHREGSALLDGLVKRAARWREGGGGEAGELAALADVIDGFVDQQWSHMRAEEKLVLPLARRHLDDADWMRIESAFRAGGALARGGAQDAVFARMFARLANQAAAGAARPPGA
jgi:nucleotide-binding universal stress UspA family protein/hemerythrin-like domain-containing protein